MPRSKQRRIHVELAPPVEVQVDARLVGFVGANLLNRVVMVEYDVDPAISERRRPAAATCLRVEVRELVGEGSPPVRGPARL
jgi:hypothetical protein